MSRVRQLNTPKAVDQAEFYVGLAIAFIIVVLIRLFAPNAIPFTLFQFWKFDWSWERFLQIPWWLLLVVPVLAFITLAITKNPHWENIEIANSFKERLVTSIKAGIFEEVSFRWILFYIGISLFYLDQVLINWLNSISYIHGIMSLHWLWIVVIIIVANLIGLIGLALFASHDTGPFLTILGLIIVVLVGLLDLLVILIITKWWYTGVLFPLVNFITLGKFSEIFSISWPVGAAMLSVNYDFGKGHIYQGPFGAIHAWVIGMVMFWLMFNFGLLAAMLIHALFDIAMDVIITSDAVMELKLS